MIYWFYILGAVCFATSSVLNVLRIFNIRR
jgi:hypothetical protein